MVHPFNIEDEVDLFLCIHSPDIILAACTPGLILVRIARIARKTRLAAPATGQHVSSASEPAPPYAPVTHGFAASDCLLSITAHAHEYFRNLESFNLPTDQAFKSAVRQRRASNDTSWKV
ncbi:hypothetical protein MMC29_000837 [Sticta canariensis]|nr:hypothetical protein [Sticta canariensis]